MSLRVVVSPKFEPERPRFIFADLSVRRLYIRGQGATYMYEIRPIIDFGLILSGAVSHQRVRRTTCHSHVLHRYVLMTLVIKTGSSSMISLRACVATRVHFNYLPARSQFLHPSKNSRLRSSMSVQQPPWSPPKKETEEPVLRLYNSLTKTKVDLSFYCSIHYLNPLVRMNSFRVTGVV